MEEQWKELEPQKEIPAFFKGLRMVGMGFILVSAVFLGLKNKTPLFELKNFALSNGALGQLLLLIGAVFFGIYFLARIIHSVKSK